MVPIASKEVQSCRQACTSLREPGCHQSHCWQSCASVAQAAAGCSAHVPVPARYVCSHACPVGMCHMPVAVHEAEGRWIAACRQTLSTCTQWYVQQKGGRR